MQFLKPGLLRLPGATRRLTNEDPDPDQIHLIGHPGWSTPDVLSYFGEPWGDSNGGLPSGRGGTWLIIG